MDAIERTPSSPAAARTVLPAVAERVRQVAGDAAVPENALEPALQAVVEGVGAAAGALCLFDQRDERLRLAAETGLSDEGCRRLRNVRRGDVAGWDMPLNGLLTRRIYLIDSASRNRYVPPLYEPAASIRTVACLPICAGTVPLGSLVLVTINQSITEQVVQGLQPVLREIGSLIEATRRRGGEKPAPAPKPAAAPPGSGEDDERLRAAQGEIERLTARLVESEAAVARERDQVREWERRHEQIAGELRTAAGSHDDLQRALETARAADTARAAAVTDAEAARAARAGAEAVIETLKAELVRAHGEMERLAAAAARLEQFECEAAALHQTREDQASSLQTRLDALETERAAEIERLTVRLAEAEAAAARERELVREWERRHAEIAGSLRDAAEGQDDLRRVLDTARAAAEAEAEAARAALAATRADLEQSREEIERLRASAPPELASEPLEAETEPEVVEMTSTPAAAPLPTPRPPPASTGAEAKRVIVLDADAAWSGAAPAGCDVLLIPPDSDVVGRLAEAAPGRMLVNLAARGALEALAALRAAGSAAHFWGCIAAPAADRALALGLVEVVARPLDPNAIVSVLGSYGTKGTRVITAGADVEALISLRQALTREQMSVSIAWDAKQAEDLLAMIKPGIALIDLGLPPRKGYSLVVRLAQVDPPPTLLLVPAGDDAAGFATALAEGLRGKPSVPLKRLLTSLIARD